MRQLRTVALIGYAAFCLVAISILSIPDYASWWTGPEVAGQKPDYCYAPSPSDDDQAEGALISALMIAALFVPGLIGIVRRRGIGLPTVLATGLVFFWAYSFFKQSMFC